MKIRLSLLLLVASSLPPISCSQEGPPSSTEVSVAEPPAGATGGHLCVTNEQSGDLSVIDVGARQVVATVPLGKRPHGIKVSPDGSTLYVALSGSPIAPPGVDETTLPPPDKKADGIGVFDVRQRRLLRVILGAAYVFVRNGTTWTEQSAN